MAVAPVTTNEGDCGTDASVSQPKGRAQQARGSSGRIRSVPPPPPPSRPRTASSLTSPPTGLAPPPVPAATAPEQSRVIAVPYRRSERFSPTLVLPNVNPPLSHRLRKLQPWMVALAGLLCVAVSVPVAAARLRHRAPAPVVLRQTNELPAEVEPFAAPYGSMPRQAKRRGRRVLDRKARRRARLQRRIEGRQRAEERRARAKRRRAKRRAARARRSRRGHRSAVHS